MVIKNRLLQHWLLLSNTLFTLLLSCFSYQVMALDQGCDFNRVVYHSIEKCADVFSQELASLSQDEIARYEEEFQQLKAKQDVYIYNDLIVLTAHYPKPAVLFETFKRYEEFYKYKYINVDEKIDYQEYVESIVLDNALSITAYKIIVKMLENQASLSDSEKNMLAISKQREECLDDALLFFEDTPDFLLFIHYISNKCYI